MNADIDELVLAQSGESVFAMVEASETGYMNFGGWWILNHGGAAGGPRRHKHYYYRKKGNSDSTEPKWAAVPGRVDEKMQWSVHWIAGMPPDIASTRVRLRHFKPINTDWDVDTHLFPTRRTEASDFGVDDIEIDVELQESLQRVFADDPGPAEAAAVGPPEIQALRLRLSGGKAAALGDIDAALALAREAVALLPRHPGLRLHLADLLGRSGAIDTADDERGRAAALREADPHYHFQLARVAIAKGDGERGVAHLLKVMELAPDFSEARYTLFRELRSSALDAEAAALAARWAAMAPDTVIAQETAARMCGEIGQAEQAIRSARKAIAIEPRWTSYRLLASAYLAAGDLAAAETAQQTAIVHADRDLPVRAVPTHLEGQIFPLGWKVEHIELWLQLANIAAQAGRLADAEAAARSAIACDPTSPQGHFALAKALSALGETAAAADAFSNSLTLMQYHIEVTGRSQRAPGDQDLAYATTRLRLARMLAWGKQPERAIGELKELLDSGRARLQVRLEALDLLCDLAAFDEAERRIAAMRTAGITHWRVEWAVARVERYRERFAEAAAACTSAAALNPQSDFLQYQLGLLLARRENWADAAAAYSRAVALNPKNATALRQLGATLLKLDRVEEAEAAVRRAIALRPDIADWHHYLGILLLRRKAWAEAAAALHKALEINPDHKPAREQLLRLRARPAHT